MFSGLRVVARRSTVVSAVVGRRMVRSTPSSRMLRPQLQQPSFVFVARHLSTSPPVFLDPAEVTERIMMVVKNFDQVDQTKVTPETKFADDLGLDSLDIVEVVMAIEDEFAIEIPDQEADKIVSIADAVNYIASHPMAK